MAKKKRKADKRDFNRLEQDQVNFIDTMVKALGSREAVLKHYNKDDTVCEFARTLAGVYYPSGPGTDV